MKNRNRGNNNIVCTTVFDIYTTQYIFLQYFLPIYNFILLKQCYLNSITKQSYIVFVLSFFFLQDLVQSTDSGPTFWLVWYSGKHGSRGQL